MAEKQLILSTATTIQLGPFLDKTDGVTPETGLSPTVNLSKNGGTFAARNSAGAITHDANGWYRVPLDATDTNTLGNIQIEVTEAATHLPVWDEYTIASAQDSLISVDSYIGPLQVSTARSILVGPFLSKSTKLPLTSLSVGGITCTLYQDGVAGGISSTSITLTASGGNNDMVHIANGFWSMELTATNLNSHGNLCITFQEPDAIYPVNVHASVVTDAAATGLYTGAFDVNVTKWEGNVVATASVSGVPEVDITHIGGSAAKLASFSTAIDTGNNNLAADVQQISGDTTAADNLEAACDGATYNIGGGAVTVDVTKISGDSTAADRFEQIMDGSSNYAVDETAFAATTTQFESTATEATTGHYVDRRALFTTGVLAGQMKAVTAYVISSGRGKFTCDAFTEAASNGDAFILI